MPNAQDILWFKTEFQPAIETAIAGTPFSVDMITAFACQETGEVWPSLRRQGLPTSRILELCVGDTLDDTAGRGAFPKNKAELLAAPDGDRMFALARQGLVDMASFIPAYRGAAARPDKFCHGFGIFQLDLQFFKTEPDYFLDKRYADFGAALGKCIGELRAAMRRIGWQDKTSLSDLEMAAIAIAYNTGHYNPVKGLKQGYFDGSKYYGENYHAYLQLAAATARPVAAPAGEPMMRGAPPGAPRARALPAAAPAGESGTRGVPTGATRKKSTARKVARKRAAAAKPVAKKAAVKKTAMKTTAVKKTVAKKRTAKKAEAKKGAARKTAATRVAAKRATAKKVRGK
ncbi:MAG TPA: hypothetical protein VNS61_05160 [Caldimonas sp.]|nr:hypothetical protein [Caldimonas sp.]